MKIRFYLPFLLGVFFSAQAIANTMTLTYNTAKQVFDLTGTIDDPQKQIDIEVKGSPKDGTLTLELTKEDDAVISLNPSDPKLKIIAGKEQVFVFDMDAKIKVKKIVAVVQLVGEGTLHRLELPIKAGTPPAAEAAEAGTAVRIAFFPPISFSGKTKKQTHQEHLNALKDELFIAGTKHRYLVYFDGALKNSAMLNSDGNTISHPRTRVLQPTGMVVVVANPLQEKTYSLERKTENSVSEVPEVLQTVLGLGGSSAATQEAESEEDGAKVLAENDSPKEQLNKFKQLAAQLEDYKAYQAGKPYLDQQEYLADWAHLNQKLKEHFGVYGSALKLDAVGQQLLKKIKSTSTGEEYIAYQTAVEKAVKLYASLSSLQFYQSFAPLKPGNVDELQYELTIKQGTDPSDNGTKTIYKIPVRGGLKIDFSSGLFVSGLFDRGYTTRTQTSMDTSYFVTPTFQMTDSIIAVDEKQEQQILEVDRGKAEITLGGLMHFYTRQTRFVNGALSIGGSVNSAGTTRYMGGGSLLLGYQRRFAISGGVAMGNVKRLGSGLEVGGILDAEKTEVPTRDVFKTSWFLGFTYNIPIK
ncbi:MAG: hypothetical protein ACFB10_26415 [Salibacteraceae bacterium]